MSNTKCIVKQLLCAPDVLSYAALVNDNVYTWGRNITWQGRQSSGITEPYLTPTLLSFSEPIIAIDNNNFGMFALTQSGNVFYWGYGLFNGRLYFNKNSTNNSTPPVVLPNLPKIKQLSCSEDGVLFLTIDGEVYGWGKEIMSKLAPTTEVTKTGIWDSLLTPTKLNTDTLTINSIHLGTKLIAFIDTNSKLYICSEKTQYKIQYSNLDNVNKVCGETGLLAILKNNKIMAYGDNTYRSLGIDKFLADTVINTSTDPDSIFIKTWTEVIIPNATATIKDIYNTYRTTFFVLNDGSMYYAGFNLDQIDPLSKEYIVTPTKHRLNNVQVVGITKPNGLFPGYLASVNNRIYLFYLLGDSEITLREVGNANNFKCSYGTEPAAKLLSVAETQAASQAGSKAASQAASQAGSQTQAPITTLSSNCQVQQLFAGGSWEDSTRIYMYAALINNSVYTWGTNTRLIPGLTATNIPTLVNINAPISDLYGNEEVLFAITNTGQVYGWGNINKLVTMTNYSAGNYPMLIPGLVNIKKIAVGIEMISGAKKIFLIALTNDGKIYACGSNQNGVFGNGTTSTTPITIPTLIALPFAVKDIECGYNISGFLDTDNNLHVAGLVDNASSTTKTTTPIKLTTNVKQFNFNIQILVLYNDNTLKGMRGSSSKLGLGSGTGTITTLTQITIPNLPTNTTITGLAIDDLNSFIFTSDGSTYACGGANKQQIIPSGLNTYTKITALNNATIFSSSPYFLIILRDNTLLITISNTGTSLYPVDTKNINCAVPVKPAATPKIAQAPTILPTGASASFMPASLPASASFMPASLPASASFMPASLPASASLASASASLTGSTGLPSKYAPAFSFKSLLDREESKIARKEITKPKQTIVTQDIEIVLPKKQDDRCSRLIEEKQYNPNKTYDGNLIDWVVCGTQNLIKRIGSFF